VSYAILWGRNCQEAIKVFYFFLIAGLYCKVSCNLKVLEISTTELEKISKNFNKIKK
jgi:hypothetical protein